MNSPSLYRGLIDRYIDRLPIANDATIISLCEGDTPLIRLHNIERYVDRPVEIYAKFEGLNPTGSFKDRGMTMAVTQAVKRRLWGHHLCIHGQYFGISGGLCSARGYTLICIDTRRKNSLGQISSSDDSRCVRDSDQGQFR